VYRERIPVGYMAVVDAPFVQEGNTDGVLGVAGENTDGVHGRRRRACLAGNQYRWDTGCTTAPVVHEGRYRWGTLGAADARLVCSERIPMGYTGRRRLLLQRKNTGGVRGRSRRAFCASA